MIMEAWLFLADFEFTAQDYFSGGLQMTLEPGTEHTAVEAPVATSNSTDSVLPSPNSSPLSSPDLIESASNEVASKKSKVDKVSLLQRRFESLSKLSADFLALLSASTLIATFGLFQNSAGVIIGAMIIAPLMRPLLGLSLGLLTADLLLLRRALTTLLIGTLIAVTVAAMFGVLLQEMELTSEILARTKPTLLDLGVAIFAGGIGAYCQAKEELQDSLAGVAIAVALVPPLCVVGIGLAFAQPELWQGASLLYLTNLVGITISGAIVLLLLGYVSMRNAKQGLLASFLALIVLIIPLGVGMNDMLLENRLRGEIRQILQERTHTFKNVRLRDVEINRYRQPLLVVATVFSDAEINSRQVKLVQDFLSKQLGQKLDLRIKIIPLLEILPETVAPVNNRQIEPVAAKNTDTETRQIERAKPGDTDTTGSDQAATESHDAANTTTTASPSEKRESNLQEKSAATDSIKQSSSENPPKEEVERKNVLDVNVPSGEELTGTGAQRAVDNR